MQKQLKISTIYHEDSLEQLGKADSRKESKLINKSKDPLTFCKLTENTIISRNINKKSMETVNNLNLYIIILKTIRCLTILTIISVKVLHNRTIESVIPIKIKVGLRAKTTCQAYL